MRSLAIVPLTLLLAACVAAPTHTASVPAAPESANYANDTLDAVLWFQGTVERDQAYRTVFRAAERAIDRGLADNLWNALVPAEVAPGKMLRAPAVIVDVDETVLDNSSYRANVLVHGREYADPTWEAYVETRKSLAIPGALTFVEYARTHGVAVYYISNRKAPLLDATLDNLRRTGFPEPLDADHVLLAYGPGCETQRYDKGCRRLQVAAHHRVLAVLGDQLVDFIDLPENTPAARAAAVAPYDDWFGERWFMLPNPMYGSWLRAVSGELDRPWAERHQRKNDHLRTDDP